MKKKATVLIMLTVVITAAILIIVFTGSGGKSAVTVPEGAKAGDIILKPCIYETGSVKYDAESGVLIVPESRGDTDSQRLIALPVMRVRTAADAPSEPIFYLSGGPGMSNMVYKPSSELLESHDIVLIGYRGVDGSIVLDCPDVSQAFKGRGNDLMEQESIDAINEAFKKDAARLEAEGVDLDAYTMLDVIGDMEAARMALGYEQINLLSESYGTRVAQIYAYQHPDIIYRSAMIGVNPPGHFVWEPDTIDRQLEYYSQLYAAAMGSDAQTADLAQTMRNVAHNMPGSWFLIPIDTGKVRVTTFALLFNRDTATMVFDAYIAAEKGDPSGLALMSLAYDFIMPSMFNWGDLASKAASADFDPVRDYGTEMDPPDSIIGAPLSKVLWSCDGWPTAAIPEEYRRAQPSDVETLLVSGSVDFSTPAEYATNELLPYLSNGKQVILKEMGHTQDMSDLQRSATMCLLTSFYDTGTADDSLYKYAPMKFNVSMGFPVIAKLSLGIILVLVLVIAGAVLLIIRSRRRRRMKRASLSEAAADDLRD